MTIRYELGTNRRKLIFAFVFAGILYLISIMSDTLHFRRYTDLFYAIWGVAGILFYYQLQSWFERDESIILVSQREQERKIDFISIGITVIPILLLFLLQPEGLLLLTNLILIFLCLYIVSAYLRGFLKGGMLKSIAVTYSALFSFFIMATLGMIKDEDHLSRALMILSSMLFATVYYLLLDYNRFRNVFVKLLGIGSAAWFLFLSLWRAKSQVITMADIFISFIFIFVPIAFTSKSVRGFPKKEQ